MNNPNYHRKMMEIIEEEQRLGRVPKLLLHSCCAPCSSYCLEVLSRYFEVTVYYYNPNIYPEEEYHMRVEEQRRFIESFPATHPISFVEGKYDTGTFYEMARGMEQLPEGGKRCFACYRLRLQRTMEYAAEHGFDYFTTTLSISPLKNSSKLNEIGSLLETLSDVSYLYSDFKKQNGYKRSTEISKEYEMYRQYYCGCVFSKRERDEQIARQKNIQDISK